MQFTGRQKKEQEPNKISEAKRSIFAEKLSHDFNISNKLLKKQRTFVAATSFCRKTKMPVKY